MWMAGKRSEKYSACGPTGVCADAFMHQSRETLVKTTSSPWSSGDKAVIQRSVSACRRPTHDSNIAVCGLEPIKYSATVQRLHEGVFYHGSMSAFRNTSPLSVRSEAEGKKMERER